MSVTRKLDEYFVPVQDVPAVQLFVAEGGNATRSSLLVIHGGPDRDHTYLIEPLVNLNTRRVIFIDLRGCGRSTRGLGDAAYTPAAATQDLVCLLDALSIECTDLLGFSYGGVIAQRLAVAAPTRIGRLIIASSSVLPVPTRNHSARHAGAETWTPEDTRRLAVYSAKFDVWNVSRLPTYIERLSRVHFSAEWARPWLAGTPVTPLRRCDPSTQRREDPGVALAGQARHDFSL